VTPVLLFECMEIADVIITVVVIVAVVTQRSLPTIVLCMLSESENIGCTAVIGLHAL
jgi:hypothetical protein